MTVADFLNLLSIVVGFVSGLYFCLASALLGRNTIAKLTGTYWGENPHFASFLRSLKSDYLCGGIALSVTFALQFLTNVPDLLPSQVMFESPLNGLLAALAAGLVCGASLFLLRTHLRKSLARGRASSAASP